MTNPELQQAIERLRKLCVPNNLAGYDVEIVLERLATLEALNLDGKRTP